MLKKAMVLLVVSLFVFSGAHAMNLTSAEMERFIKTTKLLAPYFSELDDDAYEDEDDGDDMAIYNIEETKRIMMEAMAGNSEIRSIVGSHGYSSVGAYAETYAYVIRAYMAAVGMERFAEFERSVADMDPEQREAFKNSPVYQMFSETKVQLASVPQSHITAVTPYMTQLHEVFIHDDDEDDYF
ncbi:hypothetical protein [Desulfonatronum parangueonense]